MTEEIPADVRAAFDGHDAYEATPDGYRLTTTAFDSAVRATAGEDWRTEFSVVVTVPTLEAAAADAVGEAVVDGWCDTLRRRLEDAPTATRASVDLDAFAVERDDGTVTVRYEFTLGSEEQGVAVAKTFIEYVEGTYVEGVVPGYEYESPVTDLLGAAATDGDGERGGTPL